MLGWIGPVSVSEPDGLLLVGVAGKEDDFLVDDVVLGGVARLGVAENWGIDRWWRTTNGAALRPRLRRGAGGGRATGATGARGAAGAGAPGRAGAGARTGSTGPRRLPSGLRLSP